MSSAPSTLRLLHGYSGNLYGGIEALLSTFARSQGVGGLEHEFALCFEGRLADELRAAGATVRMLAPARFSRPWTALQARRRLRAVLAERRPDIFIGHACWSYGLLAAAARRAGLPVVFWMHDGATGRHWSERLAARTPPDLALVNSHYTAGDLPRLFPGIRHAVAHPIVPAPTLDRIEARSSLRRALGVADSTVVIVQSSRLEPWKGQSLLIAALGRLRDVPNWTAWIAGGAQRPHEAAYLASLEADAAALGIADLVAFLGQRSDIPRLLAAADIHCQPNLGPEPFGIAFIEAMQAGLPLVSTRLGAAPELIDASCGMLVPPNDPAALAEALAGLIADLSSRRRLGSSGPARAATLADPTTCLNHVRSVLSPLVARGEKGSGAFSEIG